MDVLLSKIQGGAHRREVVPEPGSLNLTFLSQQSENHVQVKWKRKVDREEYGPLQGVHLIVHAKSRMPESLRPELIHPPWYESPWPGGESSEHA